MSNANGFYYIGTVRGVKTRHRPAGKTKEGKNYDAFDEYSFVVEGDNLQDESFRLTIDQQKQNWPETLRALAGKRVSFDCHYTMRNGYLTWYLDTFPVELKAAPVRSTAAA